MALSVDAIAAALKDHAMTLGLFETVSGHEVKNAPGLGMHCEIFFNRFELGANRSGLSVVSTKLIFSARLRTSFLNQPEDAIEASLLKAVDGLMTSYIGGLTLGGLIVDLDVFGMTGGTPIAGQAGYIDHGGKKFRVIDIDLPLLVDDLWTEAN